MPAAPTSPDATVVLATSRAGGQPGLVDPRLCILPRVRVLAELPHRFWPERQLPADVKVWPKSLNLKTAEFARVYNRKVNPRLRALGFTCKAMRSRRRDGDVMSLGWFAGGKYGGSGSLAFAATHVALPSWLHRLDGPDEIDFPGCVFYRPCTLHDDRHHGADFDLGKDVAEAEETAELVLEVIEEQGVPFLAGVPVALAALTALRVDEFEARVPDLVREHHICNATKSPHNFEADRAPLALMIARLVRIAGRPDDAAAWARMGREFLKPEDHPYWRHMHDILFDKLIAGDPDLTLTAADRAEHDRRLTRA